MLSVPAAALAVTLCRQAHKISHTVNSSVVGIAWISDLRLLTPATYSSFTYVTGLSAGDVESCIKSGGLAAIKTDRIKVVPGNVFLYLTLHT